MSLYENIVHRRPFVVGRKKSKALVTTNDERKTTNPLYGYIKNVMLPGFTNKIPNLSSFTTFSIDETPVKGYHVIQHENKSAMTKTSTHRITAQRVRATG